MTESAAQFEQLSWRDPDGFVLKAQNRILRAVALARVDQTQELMKAPWFVRLSAEGHVPQTLPALSLPQGIPQPHEWLWLEHPRLAFPCYPHEITALQLFDAAKLTLMLAQKCIQNGWALKDASAWNVVFNQGKPAFIDLLSFEKREPTGIWLPYGQFVRHFLLPLLLYKRLGITPPEVFLAHRDGIAPERAYRMLRGLRRLSPTELKLVLLPKLLAQAGRRLIATQSTRKMRSHDAVFDQQLLLRTLKGLERTLERLRPKQASSGSVWQRYEEERKHYSAQDLAAKRQFVTQNLQDPEIKTVLDFGCNAGEYSLLAAECDKSVVAADSDHAALSRLYERIRGKSTAITPLMLDVARPTAAIGWQNREVASFLNRSAGQFDCILFLGLLHHLLVTERATLGMIADLLDGLNPRMIILEWIDPTDQKFQELTGFNGSLYSYLNAARLEESLSAKFRLTARLPLPCTTRVMYVWSR